jgi:hypothetical protein
MSADIPASNRQGRLPFGLRPVEWETECGARSDGFKLTDKHCKRAKRELAEQRAQYEAERTK